jgi:hypothetical protein
MRLNLGYSLFHFEDDDLLQCMFRLDFATQNL